MGRRKTKAAQARAIQAKYDAAGTGRRMAGWNPPTSGPNRAIEGLQKIRDRARDVMRNDWTGRSAVQKWSTNLIGTGVVPRFKDLAPAAKKRVMKLWKRFVKVADADGVLNFYGLQTLAVKTWLDGGEVFVRMRPRALELGLPVPMQIQLLEAEQCPMLDADTWPGLPIGNRIRSGIELNRFGRRVAYWFYKVRPNDNELQPSTDDLVRVPADQVRHVFEPERPGQLRGVSMLSSVLVRLRNIENFDDAVLTRQQIANLFALFITRPPGEPYNDGVDPMTGQAVQYIGDKPVARLAPGITHELESGEDVKFANPPEAGTTYSDYMRTQHMGTAAGAGLPYEIFSGDIKEVSDRTLRVVINEFRRLAEQRQWQVVIPMMCEPVAEWFAQAGALAGELSMDEVEAVIDAEWQPHGWQYIHPVQDVQGKEMEVNAGFRSRSSVIAERGDDPEAVDEERAADQERAKTLGLLMPEDDPEAQEDEADEDGIDNEEYSAPPNASVGEARRIVALADQEERLRGVVAGLLEAS